MSNLLNESKTEKLAKFFKFSLIVSLVLGAVLFGFLSTNMDSLREPIISELSEITGLPIQLESLNLSLSSGLSLRGNGLKVRSRDDSQQIFSAQKIFLDAKLKPLLKGQLKIRKIILINPIMDIVLRPNLKSVGSTKILKNFKASGQATKVNSGNVENYKPDEILEKKPDQESGRNLFQKQSTSLRVIEVADGELTFHWPKLDSLPGKKIPILFNAQFDLINPVPDLINIKGNLSYLEVEGLSLKGTLKANDLLAKKIPVNIELQSSPIPAKKINILMESLSDPKSVPLEFESGQIEKLFIQLKGFVDSNESLYKEVVIESEFKSDGLKILTPKIKNFKNISLHGVNGKGVWKDGILNYTINGMLWDGSIQFNIFADLPDLLRGSLRGKHDLVTKFNDLDLSLVEFNFLDKWTPVSGTAMGSLKTESFLDKGMRTYGKFEINGLSFENEVPYTIKQVAFNFSRKSSNQTLARIKFDDLQLDNMFLNTVSSKLIISPEKFSLNNGRIVPPNGIILFSGHYRPKPSTYVLHINGNKLFLSDFLKNQKQGSGFFKGMLQGNLNKAKAIQQKEKVVNFSHIADGLSGKFSFRLENGYFNSTLWIIDKLILPPTSPVPTISPKIGLNYDTLVGDFKIWKGKASTDNFELKGPQVNFLASVATNLVTGGLDGEIKVKPKQFFNEAIKTSPLIGKIFENELKDTLTENHFILGGILEKPKLTLKRKGTLLEKPTKVLNN